MTHTNPLAVDLDPRGRLAGLSRTQRLAFGAVLALSVVIFLGFLQYLVAWSEGRLDGPQALLGHDFANYWTAAVLTQTGRVAEIFNPDAYFAAQQDLFGRSLEFRAWSYPPHMLFLVYPLGFLPYAWAYFAWTAAGLAAFLYAVFGKAWPSWAGLALALSPAAVENMHDGQNGFWMAAFFVGAMRLADSRPLLAGILLGCLTTKPQLGVLIPVALLAGARWHTILSASVATGVLISASLLVHGPGAWADYLAVVAPFQTAYLESGRGAFMLMMPTPFMSARLLDLGPALAYAAQIPFSLVALGLVAWAYRASVDRDLKLAALLIAVFLFSPYVFVYDMTLMAVAVMLIAARAAEAGHSAWEGWVLAAVWFMPMSVKLINHNLPFVAPFLILLTALIVVCRLRPARRDLKSAGQ